MVQELKRILKVHDDAEHLAAGARDWLVGLIREHQNASKNPFSIALSGGSTPKRLYQLLAELPTGEIDWSGVKLVWGDERNVPRDHADSNFQMVKENLLDKIEIPVENVLGVPNPGDDAKESALEYESLLKEHQLEQLDAVILGMGDDVHTASLFPGTTALAEKERLVIENWVPKLGCWRITFSAAFLNRGKNVAFLLAGSGKNEALSSLWQAPYQPEKYPSQLIKPQTQELTFLLDVAALGELQPPDPFEISRVE